jgi:D-cysteine desulfhydrase
VTDPTRPAEDPQPADRPRDHGVPAPALFRRFPALEERIAWLPLGRFPTPVQALRVPSVQGRMYVKRDDLTGEPYGGNKLRKLEFILAEARRRGAQRLITAGAAGSHHALATAVYGRALGFRVTLVLFPQPLTEHVREVVALDHALGAEIRFVPWMEAVPAGVLAARVAHRRERCMVVAPGGSDPVGTLGYVSAGLELAEQIGAGALPQPSVVHVAAGTLGTGVGLALGLALAGIPTPVVGTRIASRLVTNGWTARRLARGAAALLANAGGPALDVGAALASFRLDHRQIGRGYGRPTADARRAAEVLGERGLRLDPTYTAKAAVSFLDGAQYDTAGGVHLFWHTLSAAHPASPDDAPAADTLPASVRRYLGRSG